MQEGSSEMLTSAHAAEPAVLAAALAQMTGDPRWAEDERLEGLRQWRLGEAKLDADGERYLQEAAEVLQELASGRSREVSLRDPESLLRIAQRAIDANLSPSFLPKLQHHLDPECSRVEIDPVAISRRGLKVTIVGAGMSGLGLAFALAEAGIDFEVLEMSQEIGGVWFDNVYPECGVDTQAFQYSFDSEPNYDWTRFDVKRDEILQYVQDAALKRGVLDKIQFGVKVETATYESEHARWRLDVERSGQADSLTTDVLVVAVGSLNRPKIPEIPGLESFGGDMFHTARWRSDVSLEGKRVAIVGIGSSGVQVARPIADVAGNLLIFQRSPQWIRPRRPNEIGEVTEGKRWLLRNLPNYLGWYRFYLDWALGDREHHRMILQETPEGLSPSPGNDAVRQQLTAYIRAELGDREDLIAKVTPTYPPYAKRLVVDNGWYAALTRPNVHLVSDGVECLTESGIRTTSGEHYDLDVVVWATGFHGTRYFWPLEIIGADGRRLAETFGSDDDLRSYLGVVMAGYPNFFSLQGPNTTIGHGGGATLMSESQGRFILTALKLLIEGDARSIAVKPEVVEEYNDLINERMEQMVWTEPGMRSRFLNTRGRVITNHPFTLLEFFERTRSLNPSEFDLEPAAPGDGDG